MDNLDEVLIDILNKVQTRIIYNEEKILKDVIGDTLSIKEFHTLEVVYSSMLSKTNTAGTIANRLGITLGTCTTNIDRLVGKGLINKIKNDNDRRVVYIELTEKGQQVYLKHISTHKKLIAKVISKLTMSEKASLLSIIGKMDI